jgi:hypothetical protein
MKLRNIGPIVVLLFAGSIMSFAAANPNLGTWKLNEAKSKLAPGAAKNLTVVYAAAGDMIKGTIDGLDGAGKPSHNEWTGKFDGKDYPVTGDPSSDSRAFKPIDDHTWELTVKKSGKVTMSGRIVLAADGKSRTVTIKGTNAAGKSVESVAVYEKQ